MTRALWRNDPYIDLSITTAVQPLLNSADRSLGALFWHARHAKFAQDKLECPRFMRNLFYKHSGYVYTAGKHVG
jgi:hypothetical protein